MRFNKGDLPYLYQDETEWQQLANGIKLQLVWEYSLEESNDFQSLDDVHLPVLLERIRRRQIYHFADYEAVAIAVDEWQYADVEDLPYAKSVLGYRGYWQGRVLRHAEPALPPEVGVLLGLTPNYKHVPAYIETVSQDELLEILDGAREWFAMDAPIAFDRPLPIATAQDTPYSMTDALRRVRAETGLLITRGHASVIDMLMNAAGVIVDNGGWHVTAEEIGRRKQLGLRP